MTTTAARFPDQPFTAADLQAAGVRRRHLRAALANRVVLRLLRGVFVRADVEVTTLVRLRAAALVINPQSVVCDRTAAWIWGVDVFGYAELDGDPPLQTCVLRGRDPTDRAEVDSGTRDLWPSDWVEVQGVRVTTPLRTALDLGCGLSRRSALAAMDALMRAHGFTHHEMLALLPRYFRRRGVVQLRQLVPLVDPRSESPAESWTRLEIIDDGLPAPTPNYWVVVDGVPTFRLDLAYPHARIVVEYDGQEFHEGPDAKARDEPRRAWLTAQGWLVIVLDKSHFRADASQSWLVELRHELAARGVLRRA